MGVDPNVKTDKFLFPSSAGGTNPGFQGLRLPAVHGGAGAELQERRSDGHEKHLQRGGVRTEARPRGFQPTGD